jgi:spermidine synthase
MTAPRPRSWRIAVLWLAVVAAGAAAVWYFAGGLGTLELDFTSDYSRIKVTRRGDVRTLWFVRDSGEEVIESVVDLHKPHDLMVEYTRFMFLSYLFAPWPERVLIVGLGGGSMVHFLAHYDPAVKVDAVEIDPAVISIADQYFNVRTGGNVTVLHRDAFDYLSATEKKYDVIFMDAFLKPKDDTDATGAPLRLKTIQFYRDLQKNLTPTGVASFNLNPHPGLDEDLGALRAAFAQIYVFRLSRGGVVVVGSQAARRIGKATLLDNAAVLTERFRTSYSFRKMAEQLVEGD